MPSATGKRLAGCGKTRFCPSFWVAHRFTAGIEGFFSFPASAAEVDYTAPNKFCRKPPRDRHRPRSYSYGQAAHTGVRATLYPNETCPVDCVIKSVSIQNMCAGSMK